MSVEAPNNIKFQSPLNPSKTAKSPSDISAFQELFYSQSSQYKKREDFSPRSPKQRTLWMEYPSGDHQHIESALKQMTSLKQDGLLKFTNIKSHHHSFNSVLNGVQQTPTMRHLIIRQSSLSHHHLQTVAKVLQLNDGIAWLVLDHNKIDDRGVREIADGLSANKGIKHVVLSDNLIKDDGAMSVAQSLKKHPNVESLWLQGNQISDNGVEAICQLVENHSTLKTIDLRDNQISPSKLGIIQTLCEKKGIRCYG